MMMPAPVRLFLLIAILQGCKQPDEQRYIIEADLGKTYPFLEGQTVYLENLVSRVTEDSAQVRDGKFRIVVPADRFNQPTNVTLNYKSDVPGDDNLRLMGYASPYLTHISYSNFYLERGLTRLEADITVTTKKRNAELARMGKRMVSLQFTTVRPQIEPELRDMRFRRNLSQAPAVRAFNASVVKRYPHSLYLVDQLNYSRESITEAEISYLLTLFDASVKATDTYKKALAYTQFKRDRDDFLTTVSMKTPEGSARSIGLTPGKYNLVVFWASWCGPCRAEIPQLKALHSAQRQNVAITSVSIDTRNDRWKQAMHEEQMPWTQLLAVHDTSFAQLDKAYGLRSIPVLLLFDPNRKLIERQVGGGTGDSSIDRHIARLLAKK